MFFNREKTMIQVQGTEALPDIRYCNSVTAYSRFKTREVPIGGVPVGGGNPIRIQSMTTTGTMDTYGTVEQAIRIIQAGGDYVRITAPSMNEARNLEKIKKELRKRGYATPLIADIHFTPNAAEVAARIVEKVRINPGNYADRKKFEQREYTESEYLSELERIREQFVPLVRICKEYGTAMRIGANHGSLSDRIMNRFGDTPNGMVESAMEFVRICEDEGFYNLVLSMKASNPIVMIQAYRLLMNAMILTKRNYPLHIGVTEAGEGVDARVKSAVGIGTLLEDGIGDTIRVSLAEDPEFEIPVAIALAKRYEERKSVQSSAFNAANPEPGTRNSKLLYSPFNYNKRSTHEVKNIGGRHVPVVVADFSRKETVTPESLSDTGYVYSDATGAWKTSDAACDYIYMGKNPLFFIPPSGLGFIYDYEAWKNLKDPKNAFPLFTTNEYLKTNEFSDSLHFLTFSPDCYRVSHFLTRPPPLSKKLKTTGKPFL